MAKNLLAFIKQGIYFPKHFIMGRLTKSTMKLENLKSGQGAIIDINDKKIAAFKNDQGEVTYLSPVCKHLGCIVDWNAADQTWDCPCHGSRYEADGALKQGPAKSGLDKVEI